MRKTSSHITDEQAENIIKIFDSFNGNYNDIDDSENNPVSNESDSGYSENYSQNNESNHNKPPHSKRKSEPS